MSEVEQDEIFETYEETYFDSDGAKIVSDGKSWTLHLCLLSTSAFYETSIVMGQTDNKKTMQFITTHPPKTSLNL